MVVDRIKEARYDFYGDHFDQISTEAKEFIAGLLQKNPEYRMSADQALEHDWITVSLSLVGLSFSPTFLLVAIRACMWKNLYVYVFCMLMPFSSVYIHRICVYS